MSSSNLKFIQGFQKTASHLPEWFKNSHKKMDGARLTSYSKLGIRKMLKRRGIK